MDQTIDHTLREMNYYDPSPEKSDRKDDIISLKDRINDLVYNPENYIINPWFNEAIKYSQNFDRIKIVTDGPRCLVEMLFPQLPQENIVVGKSHLPPSTLLKLSDIHIGTNKSDLALPQTAILVNRKLKPSDFPNIDIVSRLSADIIEKIFHSQKF